MAFISGLGYNISVDGFKELLEGGAAHLATKSILKTVHIKEKKSAVALINALENSKTRAHREVELTRPYSDASLTDIKKMFGAQNDRI